MCLVLNSKCTTSVSQLQPWSCCAFCQNYFFSCSSRSRKISLGWWDRSNRIQREAPRSKCSFWVKLRTTLNFIATSSLLALCGHHSSTFKSTRCSRFVVLDLKSHFSSLYHISRKPPTTWWTIHPILQTTEHRTSWTAWSSLMVLATPAAKTLLRKTIYPTTSD